MKSAADSSCTKWQPVAVAKMSDEKDIHKQYHVYRTFHYTIEKDKRVDCRICEGRLCEGNDTHKKLIRELKLVLPEFLNEQLWQRHQYSLDDIKATLEHSPTTCLWQMCLYHNIPLLQSASKISSTTSLIRGGRRNGITYLMNVYRHKYADWKQRPSVLLLLCGNRQRMPLPCHKITSGGMQTLKQLLPQRNETQHWFGQPLRQYQSCVKWTDGFFVPLAFYPKSQQRPVSMILLNRIMPKPLYDSVFSVSNQTLVHQPDMLLLRDTICCVLDEAFFVWSDED